MLILLYALYFFFFFKQKTADEMRISDWSSDVCSSDLFVPAMLEDHGRTKVKGHGFSCHACVLRHKSRGSVTLASGDAAAAPAIDPGFLTDARDMATDPKSVV